MNGPNMLTMYRIFTIPFIVVLLTFEWPQPYAYIAAMLLFLSSGITDVIDGRMARKYNEVTDFGRFMDPLADKMLVCSTLVCFVGMDLLPAWIVIIVIAREFAISGLRQLASEKGVVISANGWGKFKTYLQDSLAVSIMVLLIFDYCGVWKGLYLSFEGDPAWWSWFVGLYANVAIWMTLIFTLLSLYTYFRANREAFGNDY